MISVQVYPVMDGLEVWAAASCPSQDGQHANHTGDKASSFIERERLDKYGPEVCVGSELTFLLAENPLMARYAAC